MDHVAIMKRSWGLIPKILSGQKRIESRWYQTKRAPWDRVRPGDRIFFKNSGEPVVVRAVAEDVFQFSLTGLDDIRRLIGRYGRELCLVNPDPDQWARRPNYVVLIRLKNPVRLAEPFFIRKRGFGIGAAWLSVDNIDRIKIG